MPLLAVRFKGPTAMGFGHASSPRLGVGPVAGPALEPVQGLVLACRSADPNRDPTSQMSKRPFSGQSYKRPFSGPISMIKERIHSRVLFGFRTDMSIVISLGS